MKNITDLAIIINGELRNYYTCRKTMSFLDQEGLSADIYFSTWNTTSTENKVDAADREGHASRQKYIRTVTWYEIKQSIPDIKEIKLFEFNEINNHIPPIVFHWKSGLEMIANSSVNYKYVLMLRPDLYFSPNSFLEPDKFHLFEDSLGMDNGDMSYLSADEHASVENGILPDTIFFSTVENINNLVNRVDYVKCVREQLDWHAYLYDIATKELGLKIRKIPITGRSAIGRYGIQDGWTIDQVHYLYHRSMR